MTTLRSAAFFDVDRTLLAGSSGLHLARPLKRRGLITTRQLARTMLVGIAFAAQGSDDKQLDSFTVQVGELMRGWDRDTLMSVVEEELERRVRPMVFDEALARIAHHQGLNEHVYAVSATLEEVIEPLAHLLGLDGALASRMEVRDGVFTGALEVVNHGPEKAARVRAFAQAEGIDLAASSAYSDSITDEEFLRAVGHPYAVNPDKALKALAEAEGWPILRFTTRVRVPLHHRRSVHVGALALAGTAAFAFARRRAGGRRGAGR
jgi:HAD superfamily hydrolase (TIGR01490 family)